MNKFNMNIFILGILISSILAGSPVYADAPVPWQLDFQDPASPAAGGIQDLHHKVFFYLIVVAVFVLWMLTRILFNFNSSKNPTPSNVTHGVLIKYFKVSRPFLY